MSAAARRLRAMFAAACLLAASGPSPGQDASPQSAQEPVPVPGLPSADEYWRHAEKRDSAQAYRCFLHHYPKDARANVAARRWEVLDYLAAEKEGTRSALRRFRRRHPGTAFVKRGMDQRGESQSARQESWNQIAVDSPLARRATSILIDLLKDPAPGVRREAAGGLGKAGHGGGVPGLLEALKDAERTVRCSAAEALGNVGDAEATEGLLATLRDPDWTVGLRAAGALSEIRGARAVEGLVEALKDARLQVRQHAARALGAIGGPQAEEALLGEATDSNPLMRGSVLKALGEAGEARTVKALLEALKDPDRGVRSSAAVALGEVGDALAVGGLLAALKDADPYVRQHAAESIGAIRDPRSMALLLEGLKDLESAARVQAVVVLGDMRDPSAVSGLLGTLEDPDKAVRKFSAWALGRVRDPRAVDGLLAAARDPNWDVRKFAAGALGEIGDVRAVEGLLRALQDADGRVRTSAAMALCTVGDSRAVGELTVALGDPEEAVRGSAAGALREIGDVRAVEGLLRALDHSAWTTRSLAAEALGAMGDSRAVKKLVEALKDTERGVRAAAAGALGKVGDSRAMSALVTATPEDRVFAYPYIEALAALAVRHGTSALREVLHSESEGARRTAAEALSRAAQRRAEVLLGDARVLNEVPLPGERVPSPPMSSLLDQVRVAGSRVGMGDVEALRRLKDGLTSQDTEVALEAIAGVVETRDRNPAAVGDLKKALAEIGNESVKLKLAGELATLGDEEALKGIRGLVRSEDPVERSFAVAVLGRAKQGKVAEELVKSLDDPDPVVRVHAATAVLRTLKAGPERPGPMTEGKGK